MFSLQCLLKALLCLSFVVAYVERPVIGILTDPNLEIDYKEAGIKSKPELYIPEGYTHSIPSHYVQWLNSAGARVVPIYYNSTEEELDFMLSRVNGVLFTGGDLSLMKHSTYLKSATYIYNKLKELNDIEMKPIPLWGTCMGFQVMSIIQADDQSILSRGKFHTYSNNLPLYFTNQYKSSKLFEKAPKFIIDILKEEKSTVNLHKDGVEPTRFFNTPNMYNFFHALSYNYDTSSVPFISTFEAYSYPFYGVQFHPERPSYDFKIFPQDMMDKIEKKFDIELEPITHSFKAIIAGSYFADFFVNEARKNDHQFKKEDAPKAAFHNPFDLAPEDPFLINNHPIYFMGNAIESYWFK